MGVAFDQSKHTPDPSHIWENEYVPSGVMFNPKTSEITSHRFMGIDSENNLVFIPDRSIESVNQSIDTFHNYDFLENQFDDELVALSEENEHAHMAFAKSHGPLFGTMFFENGVCKEPLSMWSIASTLVNLALNIKSAIDSGDWRTFDEKELVAFNFEQGANANGNGRYETFASANFRFKKELPTEYADLTLGLDCPGGIWTSHNFDPPGIVSKTWRPFKTPQIGLFDRTEQDRKETAYDEIPGLDVDIRLNPEIFELTLQDDKSPFCRATERYALADLPKEMADEFAGKLLRAMLESLISVHTRHIHHDWIGHQFRPVPLEKIRWLWYVFAVYMTKTQHAFCKHCGKPFMKSRPDKQYCSDKCRKAANR